MLSLILVWTQHSLYPIQQLSASSTLANSFIMLPLTSLNTKLLTVMLLNITFKHRCHGQQVTLITVVLLTVCIVVAGSHMYAVHH